jgi:hypothetical protein
MRARRMALLRWTGRGTQPDLASSLRYLLTERGMKARVRKVGSSLAVETSEPVDVAGAAEYLPGVAWTAVGFEVRSLKDVGAAAGTLAERYLGKGGKFWVEAEGSTGVVGADVAGSVTSAILDAVKGARVSSESPRVRFRAAYDGRSGVVGVEVRTGPGGAPTGKESAVCFVSGGMHSSVVAWLAVLDGFRVHLVHAVSSEASLLAVARLYSELSFRADPRWLSLTVVEGASVRALSDLAGGERYVFSGRHPGGEGVPPALLGGAVAPLYLLPEERFVSEFASLGISEDRSSADWSTMNAGSTRVRKFGGVSTDVSGVLDGLG